MLKENIHYKKITDKKYKYEMLEDWTHNLNCFHIYKNKYICLKCERIIVKKGFRWDGASGFPDSKKVLRASLIHDAFYQVIREDWSLKKNEKQSLKSYADLIFKEICIEDNTHNAIAFWLHRAVKRFGNLFL